MIVFIFLDSRHSDINLNICTNLTYKNFRIHKQPHEKLNNKFPSVIDFGFKGGKKNFVKLSKNGTAFWG